MWGVGDGAPKPNIRDQVAPNGSREAIHTLDIDTTVG
jgi:hypothetical protein